MPLLSTVHPTKESLTMTIPGEAEGRQFTVEASYQYVLKVYNSGRRTQALELRS